MAGRRVNSRGRLGSWAVLVFCLVVLLPPLLVRLGINSSISSMESIALLTSQETWIRQWHGENKAWLLPSFKGATRLQKPPLNVWLDMLAWWNLDPDTTSPEIIVGRGRLISVLLGLAVLAGTFLDWTSAVLSTFTQWPTLLSIKAILLAFLFAGSVGVFFGFYPARKASLLDPIEALRYE